MATKCAPPSWSRMLLATVMSVKGIAPWFAASVTPWGGHARARDTSPDAAMIASRLASSSVVQQPFVAGRVFEVHTHTWGGMERVAGTHQRGSYRLAIRSPLSVNFAGGARRAGS